MIILCSVCGIHLGTKPGRGTTHGYCRYHELQALMFGKVATSEEAAEFGTLQEARCRKSQE